MNRTRRFLTAVLAGGAVLLSGCGIEERIVHLQPAPTESAAGAPLRLSAAEQIAARVLGDLEMAATDEERLEVMAGPANRLSTARLARGQSTAPTSGPVSVPATPTVLAISSGRNWPRAMLVATLDEETQVNDLHVLLSTDASERFTVHATGSLFGGAAVPALGDVTDGTVFSQATNETPIEASAVVEELAKALAFPTPGETTLVATDDAYSQSLARNAKAQNDALGDLANVAQTHTLIPDSVLSFATADGGEVVFAQLVRTDVITLTDKAKELKIGDPALQQLSGKQVVTRSFTTGTLENIIMVVPPGDAKAQVIGADEVVLRAEGS